MTLQAAVAVSGTVGKQVFSRTGKPVQLCSLILTPSGANATVKVRDGGLGASGEVVFFGRAPSAYGSKQFDLSHYFTKGLHVEVIGANAQAYIVYK
jgi:hypothetical protein